MHRGGSSLDSRSRTWGQASPLEICGFGKVRTADLKNGGPRYTSSVAPVAQAAGQNQTYCTVSVAVPLTFPAVAVMVTVPAAMARARP